PDLIAVLGRLAQQLPTVLDTHDPRIEVVHRLAAGLHQNRWIDKIGAGLETAHTQTIARVMACQRRGDGGLAAARCGSAHQQRWTRYRHRNANRARCACVIAACMIAASTRYNIGRLIKAAYQWLKFWA